MLFSKKELNFEVPKVMGIINLTPDSFSDGGKFICPKTLKTDRSKVLKEIEKMENQGAAFIDIGAESTRPNAFQISAAEELDRLMPILDDIKNINAVVSIDSSKGEVISEAIKNGVDFINDINSLKDKKALKLVKDHNLPVCIMHKEKNLSKNSICLEIGNFFKKKVLELSKNGISKEKIVLDPGFGYEKTPYENLEIISKFNYTKFENPCLIGISRKGFLKKLSNDPNLDQTSVTTGIISLLNGAKIIRTHNVPLTATTIEKVFG